MFPGKPGGRRQVLEAGQGGKERRQADGVSLAMKCKKSFKGRNAVVDKGQEMSVKVFSTEGTAIALIRSEELPSWSVGPGGPVSADSPG